MAIDHFYFDEVDREYYNNIYRALNNRDIDVLCELVPSLTEEEAEKYMESFEYIDQVMRQNLSADLDTTNDSVRLHALLSELFEKANLSGTKHK